MKREIFHEKHESEKSEMTFKEILTFGSGAVFAVDASYALVVSSAEGAFLSVQGEEALLS